LRHVSANRRQTLQAPSLLWWAQKPDMKCNKFN
jgi:hypothetical protein